MEVTITKVNSGGFTVDMGRGREGFVPRGEITWSRATQSPHKLYSIGQVVQVVPLNEGANGRRAILSIKATQADPWEQAQHSYNIGQDVLAIVTSVLATGIFVEWGKGIAGWIPKQEIGPDIKDANPDSKGDGIAAIGLGDALRVRITAVQFDKGHFTCSNRLAIHAAALSGNVALSDEDTSKLGAQVVLGSTQPYSTGPLSILLIDDDDVFGASTKRAFELAEHRLEFTSDPDAGIELAINGNYDIVVIDLIMPRKRGTEVYRAIHKRKPELALAIFTGESTIAHSELSDLASAPLVLHKPFEIADIEAACFDAFTSESRIVPRGEPLTGLAAPLQADEPASFDTELFVKQEVSKIAASVPHTIHGMFRWDDSEKKLHYLAGVGFKYMARDKTQLERELYFSPIRNVAEDKDDLSIESAAATREGFRRWAIHLFTYTDYFESCFATPMVVNGGVAYVVFFAHALPRMYTPAVKDRIKSGIAMITAELSRRWSYEQSVKMERLALRGELAASLAHEIRNRLHIIRMNLRSMKKLGPKAAHLLRQTSITVPKELDDLNEIIEESQSAAEDIDNVVTAFSEDIGARAQGPFDLSKTLQTVLTRVRPLSQREHVVMSLDVPDKCIANGPSARLGQVFENLIINAIRHTAPIRKSKSQVRIKAGSLADAESFFVEVSDNGEGIHARNFERIFDMGFSTRAGGSGVGLALCKETMRALGGRTFVKRSILFEGTTMRVEWGQMK